MIDDQFNIRIADFGFATAIKGDGSGILREYCGSEAYIAPEFFCENLSYQGQAVDLFALGIILFNLFDGGAPFGKANSSDSLFEKIAENRYDSFWEYFGRWRDYPEDFKDLINNMLQLDPRQRLSMADIVAHPWMLGEMATPEEVKEEIRKRVSAVTSSRKAESLKRRNSRGGSSSSNTRGARRGGEDGGYEEENKEATVGIREMEDFDENKALPSFIVSELSPLVVMDVLAFELKAKGFTYRLHQKKWQLIFDTKEKPDASQVDHDVQPESCQVQVKLLKIPDDEDNKNLIAIHFKRLSGDARHFYNYFNELN